MVETKENTTVVEIEAIKSAMKRAGVLLCLECGKCSSTCPVALSNPNFSPRQIVSRTITGGGISVLDSELIWHCLTCKLCYERCPSDVSFMDFIRSIREIAEIKGAQVPCSHGGAMQSLMSLMTAPEMKQNRLEWLTDDLKISKTGEYMLFVGCLPYYDAYFDELKINSTNIARSAVKILNKFDIAPVLSNDERCCGHDLFWSGDNDIFSMLVKRNVEAISNTGAKKIITTCAECYSTLKNLYPKYSDFPFEIIHLSEFIAKQPYDNLRGMNLAETTATYHDPCRLSRHTKIIDEPRKALTSIKGLMLNEMYHHGTRSNCCGTSSWMNCNMYSKMLQSARLKEAKATGANLLITACPKCMIHFKCAQKDAKNADELAIEIKDLAEVVSEAMG